MNIQERILSVLSKAPAIEEDSDHRECTRNNSLSLLDREYPNLGHLVSGKRVVDFGCGVGNQSIALVQKYNCSVVGIDSNQRTLKRAIEHAKFYDIPQLTLSFADKISDDMLNNFDIVISQNSFEHFSNPEKAVDEMQSLLCQSGKLLITFGPPWLAPYGSHMHFFCKVPWINVFFPQETVMKVRSRYRNDGATKYEEVESGLNKMTVSKFERIIMSKNLKIEFKRYTCVKGLNALSNVPLLREYFINHLTVVLSRAT